VADVPFIELEGVRFSYPRNGSARDSLAGVDLRIERGEFVAVIGPNGSGKSTLARCLNGLLRPSAGEVRVDGKATSNGAALPAIRRKVGMAFQDPENQIVGSTAEEDVAFGPENASLASDEIRRRVDDALGETGLSDRAESPPDTLSGGQKQRLAVAGILASDPACIVLDEPTSMLDPRGRREILALLRALHAEKKATVLLITQSMEEAAAADRVLVMNAGKVEMDGRPREVFAEAERLSRLGLGTPVAAVIARKLAENGLRLPVVPLNAAELAEALCG
jgi:energy-coupling factor transport system ATP-binding protein